MNNTENDPFTVFPKALCPRKDFQALVSHVTTNESICNNSDFQKPNIETQSFVVDWQLPMKQYHHTTD
ncbi:MAG: hypothetical protein Q8T04_05075 [Bacteroidota bacterium]|nr:hypothetical protein [Bacteroidota bacterium]